MLAACGAGSRRSSPDVSDPARLRACSSGSRSTRSRSRRYSASRGSRSAISSARPGQSGAASCSSPSPASSLAGVRVLERDRRAHAGISAALRRKHVRRTRRSRSSSATTGSAASAARRAGPARPRTTARRDSRRSCGRASTSRDRRSSRRYFAAHPHRTTASRPTHHVVTVPATRGRRPRRPGSSRSRATLAARSASSAAASATRRAGTCRWPLLGPIALLLVVGDRAVTGAPPACSCSAAGSRSSWPTLDFSNGIVHPYYASALGPGARGDGRSRPRRARVARAQRAAGARRSRLRR